MTDKSRRDCARCRNNHPESKMTRIEVGRGLVHWYCAPCMEIINEKTALSRKR